MIPDGHQATVSKLKLRVKHKIRIGMWTVRTHTRNRKLKSNKIENVRLSVNILVINELQWPGPREQYLDKLRTIYSGEGILKRD